MFEYSFGSLALSKSGHDKDNVFIILKSDSEYIYLMDGKARNLDNPKKKNKKHVQVISYVDTSLQDKITKNKTIINEDIKRALKIYYKLTNFKG